MDDVKAKQQIVDKIKEATTILITVSNDPTVDALSAALGLSLLIDKLDKHATAVFSGKVPPAINFLEPEKTFEENTDGLRDFIIALDKEKVDHLRVPKPEEGDPFVKIYVVPYRTTVNADDLTFSQGDYNVDMVIALGVDVQEHLDGALDSHGKILHDATVVSISAGDVVSNVGSIDWHDDKASSLSEMVASLAEPLKKDKNLLDKQIATAFLTGVVAATERFSNARTTSKAMTVASTLMAAGADQQLIASKLQEDDDDEGDTSTPAPTPPAPTDGDGDVLSIAHGLHAEPGETLEEMDKRVKAAEQQEAASEAKDELSDVKQEAPVQDEPSLGGTLNATTDQAAEDARQAVADDQKKTLLSHAYVGGGSDTPAMSGAVIENNDANFVDPLAQPSTGDELHSAYAFESEPEPAQAPMLQPTPISAPAPAPTPATPADLGLPMPPPLPDFSAQPPALTPPNPSLPPERLGDILAPEPTPTPNPTPEPPVMPPSNDPGQFKIPS